MQVGFEARVGERAGEGVEDVGDGAAISSGFGQWPRVRLVVERLVSVELKLR